MRLIKHSTNSPCNPNVKDLGIKTHTLFLSFEIWWSSRVEINQTLNQGQFLSNYRGLLLWDDLGLSGLIIPNVLYEPGQVEKETKSWSFMISKGSLVLHV